MDTARLGRTGPQSTDEELDFIISDIKYRLGQAGAEAGDDE